MLFGHRIVIGRQEPAVQGLAQTRDPGRVKRMKGSGIDPRPVVNGHLRYSLIVQRHFSDTH